MSSNEVKHPIVEALCEFRFDPASQWDATVPGLMYKELEQEFPLKRQRRIILNEFAGVPESPQQNVRVIDRMQLLAKDERSLVQVNQHFLSVNRLAPYTCWEDFRPRVKLGLEAYRKVAQPVGLLRIGIRYINRIVVPAPTVNLEDYFMYSPRLGPGLRQEMSQFACEAVIPYPEHAGFLSLRLRSEEGTEAESPFILDLDLFSEACELDGSLSWIDKAHQELDDVFRNCITENTRRLLGKEN